MFEVTVLSGGVVVDVQSFTTDESAQMFADLMQDLGYRVRFGVLA